jgi:hypothetical protein
MALFKCSKCGTIENHSCVNVKHLKTEYQIRQHHIPGEMINEVYPKMSKRQMMRMMLLSWQTKKLI